MDQLYYTTKCTLYTIYYRKSILQLHKINMKDIIRIQKEKEKYIENCKFKTLEHVIHSFIDIIKECVIRNFSNLKNIKFDIQFFSPEHPMHQFIFDFSKLHHFNHQDFQEDDIKKSIILFIYNEQNELHFMSLLSYNRLTQQDYEYYIYLKNLRKMENKKI